MSPVTLTPLPALSSTEVDMRSLMLEASKCYNTGQFKVSYELYMKALLSAINEFQQLEFIDQCSVQKGNINNIFSLAHTCLKHAKEISVASKETTTAKAKPKVPPKPNCLKGPASPPPLPMRPMRPMQSMVRTQSDFVKKSSNLCTDYAADSNDDEDSDTEDEDDDEACEEEDSEYEEKEEVPVQVLPRREQPIVNTSSSNKKVMQQQQQKKVVSSSASLKVITANKRKKNDKLPRASSTSNIASLAPSSPSITSAVKSFLSLPGGGGGTSNNNSQSSVGSAIDDIFLLSNGIIDPQILVSAQTSHSDNTLQQQTTSSSYLPLIPQAPLVTVYQSLQKKLDESSRTGDQYNQIQSLLNCVRNIHMSATTVPTILQFHPIIIAYQLTLIDSNIFRNIPLEAILSHSSKTPHPSIVASTDFFNYLTRLIEHAILLQQDASGRAQHMNHWIKVAGKCHELRNYQTLKAVISALGTPPIQRLKQSWSFVPKKSMGLLEDLSELMSEASNYGKYRTRLGLSQEEQQQQASSSMPKRKNSFSEPTVPFLGIFIHDMTYLVAAISKNSSNCHNSQWKATSNNVTAKEEVMMKDVRVSELLKLFKDLQRSPPYSPNVSSAICTKDINSKNRKRKISHALTRSSAAIKNKSSNNTSDDSSHDSNTGEVSIEMQQCLAAQYLLTRSWVSEKTVDELSLVRESTKTSRSYSVTDVSNHNSQQAPPLPITSSISLTTTSTTTRSSSGSLTSSSSNSRPLSLEDEEDPQRDEFMLVERKASTGVFWLFSRKSVDQGYLKDGFGTLQRSPRHFSFEELNSSSLSSSAATVKLKKQSSTLSIDSSTVRMQREGSQGPLASSIFRKDFWKPINNGSSGVGGRNPLLTFNSDPSMLSGTTAAAKQRKGSSSSLNIHPTPSTSSDTTTTLYQHQHKNLHILTSPHPLDNTSTADTAQSDITTFNWN